MAKAKSETVDLAPLMDMTLRELFAAGFALVNVSDAAPAKKETAAAKKKREKAEAEAAAAEEEEEEEGEEEEEEEEGEEEEAAEPKTRKEMVAILAEAKEADPKATKVVMAEIAEAKTISKIEDTDCYLALEAALMDIINGDGEEEEEEEEEGEEVEIDAEYLFNTINEALDHKKKKVGTATRSVLLSVGIKAKKVTIKHCEKLDDEDLAQCYNEIAEILDNA